MRKIHSIAFVILLVVVAIAGCRNSQTAIIGKWTAVEESQIFGRETIEFFEDGTVNTKSAGSGTYSFPDDTHVRFEGGWLNGVYTFQVSGDHLTLQDGNGPVREFVRSN